MSSFPDYPEAVSVGSRQARRWRIAVAGSIRLELLEQLGQMCVEAIGLARTNAFSELPKDLAAFHPQVRITPSNASAHAYNVEISYEPAGQIGDCVMIALWVPLRVIHAVFSVVKIQGIDAQRWMPFVGGRTD